MINALKARETTSTLEISEKCLVSSASKDKLGTHLHLQEKGLDLISKGKVAIALVVNDNGNQQGPQLASNPDLENSDSTEIIVSSSLQTLLCDDQRFVKVILFSFIPLRFFLRSSLCIIYTFPFVPISCKAWNKLVIT